MDSTNTPHTYRVAWTSRGAVRRVEIIDTTTGERTVGTDWSSWDHAYQQALSQVFPVR